MNRSFYLKALASLVLLLIQYNLSAQTYITGQVLDGRSRQALEGVTVTASATGNQATSDAQGRFSIQSPGTSLSLYFSRLGYTSRNITVDVATGELQVLLQPAATNLSEVVVTGYETNRPLLETVGALSVVTSEVIRRFDESSLVRAVNTVPGVRMEERAPASYRISIRGSSLRAPYGIRNVKVYFGDVPLTEASGVTTLNLIDAGNIGNIEVLKGPAGSVYGAGTGGTLLLEPKRAAPGEHQLEVGSTIGSFGFNRYNVTASTGGAKANALIQYTRQEYGGFRDQSAMERDVFMLSSEFYPTTKQTISAYFVYSDLFYQLPGGLTREQYDENPRQARGGTFGSVLQNASMNLGGVNAGLSHEYRFSNNWRNTTSVFGLFRSQDHPFNTDYERNANQEYGARSRFAYDTRLGGTEATFTVGGEYQRGFQVARTYDNNQGALGAIRSDDEVVAKTGLLFAQGEFKLPGNWIATAALSFNDTRYEIDRLLLAATEDDYQYVRNFDAIISPRVALLKRLTDQISVHASVSSGYSPPTEEEILTSNGELNEALEAEKGINYEAGIRGSVFNGRLSFDLVGFSFRLNETIVSRQDVSSVAVFRNVGSTLQNGLEANVAYTAVDDETRGLSFLQLWTSYTYNHFRFRSYQQGETDLSGNKLTGVAPHTVVSGLDMKTRPGFYLNLTTSYSDVIPLNDENTVFSDAYFIVGSRAGIRRDLSQHFGIDLFAGVDNATDKKYSLGNDLNAFGGRFFQPAPPRNYYGGLSLKYKL
ncbi:TonB-dependent receptor [Pontibacter sp. SGAir0037]|uniref:TonB-dependent receptor n=1 Tax=Pontibacter sp. SGAir0037 TaxID=2571030 RepID=UPI0010CD27CA|nr:TonB-dependent receptor [Pontibacter sp. SGAir0037]QCR23858.1 TonB-dependent receptor [Pontibacter sp. SGAir0037]